VIQRRTGKKPQNGVNFHWNQHGQQDVNNKYFTTGFGHLINDFWFGKSSIPTPGDVMNFGPQPKKLQRAY